jgi:Cu2+-containing amine oxidase
MVGGRVSWLGWSFHVTNRPRTATALHDVSFMGERIAYELSLQELQAVYTGYVPSMANKFLYDTNFYFGSTNRQLVAGVDCPKGATIFGNACVFEHDKGGPIWRKDGGRAWYAGAKGTHLVVRAIFEVGNYDYLVEFKFGLDGQIDIGFGASGQLFMSPYDAIEEPFGTRVQEEALANLHAHYGGFKVDLDILGINNCVEKESVVFKTRTEIPGADNQGAWNVPAKNLAVERQMVANETDARVRVDNMAPAQWKAVSCTEKNQWGYLKGYEIVHPNTPLAIYDEAFPGYQAYHTVFAQRKESEPYISTQFDSMTRGEPYVPITGTGVDAISNGESLDNQDIVAWVGLGFYHIPRAEDNPVTNTVLGHFSIRPFNYYDENPSLDVGQTVRYRSSVVQNDIPEGGCTVSV